MNQKTPQELVTQALDDDLVPLGRYKLRPDSSSNLLTAYPKVAREHNDSRRGDKLEMYLDQRTGALISIPVDSLKKNEHR